MPSKTPTTIQEETAIVLQEETALAKPENDTKFAHEAAKFLMDIVKQNNWSRKLGGQSEHLQYEAWQTAGKFYGYSVKTFEAEYVELGGTWGFKAKACVVNEKTGIQVGGAEAYCMSDENNWRSKPKFQLASMAQTRAGSKALRQILGFVVALAGYNPTPAEEMTQETHPMTPRQMADHKETTSNGNGYQITEKQMNFIKKLLTEKGYSEAQLMKKYEVADLTELTGEQASTIIGNLMKLPKKEVAPEYSNYEDFYSKEVKGESEPTVDPDEADKAISAMSSQAARESRDHDAMHDDE